ncbi:hypothetical protein [Paenibacillus sp. FSL K6-2524]|uniref:hypothetical protein n=1 Tax=Paenibacillus sp. FSL K6-2524 TaxID=2954516 RepID=UPI0030F79A37
MQLIKLTYSSEMTYMSESNDEQNVNRNDLLKVQYFITETTVTKELLQEIEIEVIRCKGDWLVTSYKIHDTYIEFDINFLHFSVGFENLENHEDYLDSFQPLLKCIEESFSSRFNLFEYKTTKVEGTGVTIEDENDDELDLLRIRIIEGNDLNEHLIIKEFEDHDITYEIIHEKNSLANCGASSGFFEALLMVVGKAAGSGIGAVVGKKMLDTILEKYKGNSHLIEVDNMKIKFSKIRKEISIILDIPVTLIEFHSITTCGDMVDVSFIFRKGFELTLITANCTLQGRVNYLNIEEPATK